MGAGPRCVSPVTFVQYSRNNVYFLRLLCGQGYDGGGCSCRPEKNQECHRSSESCDGAHRPHNASRRVRYVWINVHKIKKYL